MKTEQELLQLKSMYAKKAIELLDKARDYLHEHVDDWSSTHEQKYSDMINSAGVLCTKVETIEEILAG